MRSSEKVLRHAAACPTEPPVRRAARSLEGARPTRETQYRSHAIEARVLTSATGLPSALSLPANGTQQVFILVQVRNAQLSDATHVSASYYEGGGFNGGTGSLPGFPMGTKPALGLGFVYYRSTTAQNFTWADPGNKFASSIGAIANRAVAQGDAGGAAAVQVNVTGGQAITDPSLTFTTGAGVPMKGGMLVLQSAN